MANRISPCPLPSIFSSPQQPCTQFERIILQLALPWSPQNASRKSHGRNDGWIHNQNAWSSDGHRDAHRHRHPSSDNVLDGKLHYVHGSPLSGSNDVPFRCSLHNGHDCYLYNDEEEYQIWLYVSFSLRSSFAKQTILTYRTHYDDNPFPSCTCDLRLRGIRILHHQTLHHRSLQSQSLQRAQTRTYLVLHRCPICRSQSRVRWCMKRSQEREDIG